VVDRDGHRVVGGPLSGPAQSLVLADRPLPERVVQSAPVGVVPSPLPGPQPRAPVRTRRERELGQRPERGDVLRRLKLNLGLGLGQWGRGCPRLRPNIAMILSVSASIVGRRSAIGCSRTDSGARPEPTIVTRTPPAGGSAGSAGSRRAPHTVPLRQSSAGPAGSVTRATTSGGDGSVAPAPTEPAARLGSPRLGPRHRRGVYRYRGHRDVRPLARIRLPVGQRDRRPLLVGQLVLRHRGRRQGWRSEPVDRLPGTRVSTSASRWARARIARTHSPRWSSGSSRIVNQYRAAALAA
jgi:hypothetical protein